GLRSVDNSEALGLDEVLYRPEVQGDLFALALGPPNLTPRSFAVISRDGKSSMTAGRQPAYETSPV
ncbi:MAG: hypothetical protein JWM93_3644, partial [Frankiales bacterium]|nr:hypothetical protein [Frankiales bacterium]